MLSKKKIKKKKNLILVMLTKEQLPNFLQIIRKYQKIKKIILMIITKLMKRMHNYNAKEYFE